LVAGVREDMGVGRALRMSPEGRREWVGRCFPLFQVAGIEFTVSVAWHALVDVEKFRCGSGGCSRNQCQAITRLKLIYDVIPAYGILGNTAHWLIKYRAF